MKRTVLCSVVLMVAVLAAAFSAGAADYEFDLKWGVSKPWDVAVDASGNVYVTDQLNHRVQKFSSAGTLLLQWGSLGSADGQFNTPWGIAVDASGNVYVADGYNYRVQKFASDGTFVATWGINDVPVGIAVDASGYVYVGVPYQYCIQKFNSAGVFQFQWGSRGTGDGQFWYYLEGVAVGPSGDVYAVDRGNNRIQKFDSDGAFLGKWGSAGTGDGQFNDAYGIATDSSGYVYVTDGHYPANDRVQKFTGAGAFVTKWGGRGNGDGQFNWPTGIAVSSVGSVYVADYLNNRVQKFSPPNLPPEADAGGPYIAPATSWDGAEVTLDGTGSTDPDGDDLFYSWVIDGIEVGIEPTLTGQFPIGLTDVTLTVTDPSGASDTSGTTVTVTVIEVAIDIKPGDDENNINLGSHGVVSVAFLTGDGFDASTIEPATVTLAGENFEGLVKMRGKKNPTPMASLEDIDGDGDIDLLVHVEVENLTLDPWATVCALGALTGDGLVVLGEDSVNIVPPQ